MQPRHLPRVLHRQRELRLVAADRLMLRAVIGKDALHVLHLRNADHIPEEDDHAHHALDEATHNGIADPPVEEAANQRRQQEKQHHGKSDAQHHRERHDRLLQLFRAEFSFKPFFKLARLRILFLREELCRVHQRLHAAVHRRAEVDHAADQRPCHPAALLFQRLHLFHQPLGAAHDDGALLRALHQDSFDQGLSADHRLEFFPALRFAQNVFLFCHDYLDSSPIGSLTVTSVPPPSAFSSVSVPPCIVTISSQTARPMPLPRALELPL